MSTKMTKEQQPGLTARVYEILQEHGQLFERPKGVWQTHEMAIVYELTNAYTGKNDKDSGCGSCRTNHVNLARKIYQEYKATL